MRTHLSDDGTILHIHIPMALRRRGGKKVIVTSGAAKTSDEPDRFHEDPVVRALVKARRWQGMLENGEAATIQDLARQEGVDKSFMARTLRLNALAPDIVEMILAGDYPDTISLEVLRRGISLNWDEQRNTFILL
ncbi:MAG: hypothetical protein HQL85_13270 [Magnetococcales bacterium]|nr:hypothetical protein [Magnetococcales bacterium]MBF0155508.1 hypothetical protein [Magnetococcales bacterium]